MGSTIQANEAFDYIICGGGTTGCVIAGRLASESNAKILLIEAGQPSKDLENVHMPAAWSKNFDRETDYNIVSEPMPGADHRQINCSRGRLLGGSSGVNGTLCIRGFKQDFDDWDLQGWSGEEMWAYINKAENFHNKDWFKPSENNHGYNGPLHCEPHDLAPISNLVKDSMIEKGLPLYPDMFSSGETATGCGHALRTVYKGSRVLATVYVDSSLENLTILTDVTVDKVVLSNELQATGVETIGEDGRQRTFHCRKEVILSGGAYGSPAILLRSGIGPRDQLEALGIPVKLESEGVGKNLSDHPIMRVFYEVGQKGLTNDHLAHHTGGAESSLKSFRESKSGLFSSFPFGIFAFSRLDEQLSQNSLWTLSEDGRDPMRLRKSQPNIEIFNSELYGHTKDVTDFPTDNEYAFGLFVLLFSARSRGSVQLKSKDPFDNPVVDHNYLADPLDLAVMTAGCQRANEIIMTGRATKDVVIGSWPRSQRHHTFTTAEEWIPVTKQVTTTCYHPSGTCKMGKRDDPLAVLDEKLFVRGISGLRVADISVMPNLNNGHTQLPAYGIGEKAADLIKQEFARN